MRGSVRRKTFDSGAARMTSLLPEPGRERGPVGNAPAGRLHLVTSKGAVLVIGHVRKTSALSQVPLGPAESGLIADLRCESGAQSPRCSLSLIREKHMALRDTAVSFDLNGLDLGDITVTAMRDTAGTGESTYSLSSSSSTSCMGCSGCGGCSVQNPMTAETY
ncbi:hypothetical protein GCM10010232_65340 [Streptomyces amakusaensis]